MASRAAESVWHLGELGVGVVSTPAGIADIVANWRKYEAMTGIRSRVDIATGDGIVVGILAHRQPHLGLCDPAKIACPNAVSVTRENQHVRSGMVTALATMISGSIPVGAVNGIAPGASCVVVRVDGVNDNPDDQEMIDGINALHAAGCNIILCSWAIECLSEIMQSMIDDISQLGVPFIAPALTYALHGANPALGPRPAGVITVAAVEPGGVARHDPLHDGRVDLCAPGIGIPIYPTVDSVAVASGNLVAAAYMTGMVALVLDCLQRRGAAVHSVAGLVSGLQAHSITNWAMTSLRGPAVMVPDVGHWISRMAGMWEMIPPRVRGRTGLDDTPMSSTPLD